MWKETFMYNGLRAVAAGIVWAIVASIDGTFPGSPSLLPIAMPLGYFTMLLPMGLILSWLSSFFFLAGWMAGFVALIVAVGDPLVFALSKAKPDIVPAERPSFFSLRIIHFVLSPFDR
jgi:hypothetical protein